MGTHVMQMLHADRNFADSAQQASTTDRVPSVYKGAQYTHQWLQYGLQLVTQTHPVIAHPSLLQPDNTETNTISGVHCRPGRLLSSIHWTHIMDS